MAGGAVFGARPAYLAGWLRAAGCALQAAGFGAVEGPRRGKNTTMLGPETLPRNLAPKPAAWSPSARLPRRACREEPRPPQSDTRAVGRRSGAPAHSALCYTVLPSYTDLMRRVRGVAGCGASIDAESSRVPAAAVQAVPAGSPVPDRPRTRRDESFLRASPLASSSSPHLAFAKRNGRGRRAASSRGWHRSTRLTGLSAQSIARPALSPPTRARHAAVCQQQKGTADAVW